MSEKLFDMLQERGFVKDMTHPEQIKNLLKAQKTYKVKQSEKEVSVQLKNWHGAVKKCLRKI
jgi:ribosomal protein S8